MQGDVEHVAQPVLACRLAVARQERRDDPVLGGEGRNQRISRHMAARPVEKQEVATLSGFDDLDAHSRRLEREKAGFHEFTSQIVSDTLAVIPSVAPALSAVEGRDPSFALQIPRKCSG